MISHVFVGVSDFDRAFNFYSPVMQRLGIAQRFYDPATPWAGWHSEGGARPLFVIGKPYNGEPHSPGNGQMVALLAANREQVRDVHRIALAHGGVSDGEPGLRPRYHQDYYGAYLRDTEGNKLCIACHVPEPGPDTRPGRG